ncbi:MAG TPA: alpha/beta hydrolase [Acidimicrobiales bacterium]|nr:alpha/beta hydrolase [Acidimicrobiales bacterium]
MGEVAGNPADPPVILFPGIGQTRHSWRTTFLALAAGGWRAVTIDQRGHGDSDWVPDGDYSNDAFARDVDAVARQVDRPPALVGASLGGIASLLAAAEDQRLARALVLVDIGPRVALEGARRITTFMNEHVENGFASLDEAADALQRFNPARQRSKDTSGLQKNLRLRDDGRWVWHWDPRLVDRLQPPGGSGAQTRDETEIALAAGRVDLPMLLVRGRSSDLISDDAAREFLRLAPHAAYVDIAGAGHMVVGDHNDAFNGTIVDFLACQREPSSGGGDRSSDWSFDASE